MESVQPGLGHELTRARMGRAKTGRGHDQYNIRGSGPWERQGGLVGWMGQPLKGLFECRHDDHYLRNTKAGRK